MLQHGAYTLLIDSCYDRERFPTREEAIEWTWALNQEETVAVEFVLSRLFTLVDGRYVQTRIQEEIDEYHGKSLKNKKIAIDREAKRKENSTTRTRTVHESPPNHKPLTTNQEPLTKNQVTTTPPDGVSLAIWQDFVSLRKAKRAAVTKTALQGIEREAQKAGLTLQAALQEMCARGWTGFKAEWLQKKGSYHESLTTTGSSIFGGVRHEREITGSVDQENLPSNARPLRLKVVTDVDDGPGS